MTIPTDELDLIELLSDSELEDWLAQQDPATEAEVMAALMEREASGLSNPIRAPDDRESHRVAGIINRRTASNQEIGPLPEIKDAARRDAGSADIILFAETYFKATFYLPWSPYQRVMMQKFQSVVEDGTRECHAVRRGGLKSTCARLATIWAVVNGHRRFPVLVGATDPKASEHRENFFAMLKSSEILLEDFPELLPLLLKHAQPKRQYRLDGRLLTVHPKDDKGRIVFPDIHNALSCEAHVAPYSINATDASGLAFVDRHGITIRPDLIIYDDVQTPQSAKSPGMTESLEDKVTTVFGGMKGLAADMGEIMVCTVRNYDCLSDRFLNRKLHPDWNSARHASILKMPVRMDLWEVYAKLLGEGATAEDGKERAQSFYVANKIHMDEGARVAWEYDKEPGEVSALQSLMTIRATRPDFFRTDIQQIGARPANDSGLRLNQKDILARCSNVPRGVVPHGATYLTGFIDSSDEVLWWMVCAWKQDFTGWIVDYGTWPDQDRAMFRKSDLISRISDRDPDVSWEENFVVAHQSLERHLVRGWPTEDGNLMRPDLILKDWADGGHNRLISGQIMASEHRPILRPARGATPKPGRKPVHLWGDERDIQTGSHWVERRTTMPYHVQHDANIWKSVAARRLLTATSAPSSVMLPGNEPHENRLLAEHLTAEEPKAITYDNVPGVVWELLPGRDNDFFDTFYGNHVAASMLGCVVKGQAVSAARKFRTFKIPGAR